MNKQKVKLILIILAGLACLLAAVTTWHKKSVVLKEYKQLAGRRDKDIAKAKVMPTVENIFVLKKDYEWLSDSDKELRQILMKKKIVIPNLTPLQFKEELLNAQIKIKQLAGIQGTKLEESIGFMEYASGEIPANDQAPLLTKQLEIINRLLNIILKYKVREVTSITRAPQIFTALDSGAGLYQEIGLIIEMGCTPEELLNILKDISNAQCIFVVRNLAVNKIDDNRISVEMAIGEVEFINDK